MVNARTFDRQATTGVTKYLERHGIEARELRITTLRFGWRTRFNFFHRGVLVAEVYGRPEALRWMRESTVLDCIGKEPEVEVAL